MKPVVQQERELMWSFRAIQQHQRKELSRASSLLASVVTAVVFILIMAFTADAGVLLKDSIVPADTVAAAVYADTAYTGTKYFPGTKAGAVLQFYTHVNQLIGGTSYGTGSGNLTADTMLVFVQHSFDGTHWTSVVVDTLFGTHVDTVSESSIIPDLSSVIYGPYVRGMFIHRDVVEANIPDSLGNVYYWDCELYIISRH